MISRCMFCGDISPDGSVMCDSCFRLELEDENGYRQEEMGEDDDLAFDSPDVYFPDDFQCDSEDWEK